MKNVPEKKINVLPEIEGILSLSHTVRFIHNIDVYKNNFSFPIFILQLCK